MGPSPGLAILLDRAQGFLLLAGSLAVVLAAAAITLASRRFGERHTQYVAILKSLGARSWEISRLYGFSLAVLGAIGTVVGCAVGWAIQAAFITLLGDLLPVDPGLRDGTRCSLGWSPLPYVWCFSHGRRSKGWGWPRHSACCAPTWVLPTRSDHRITYWAGCRLSD